jgi:hypothetical protein
MKKLLLLTALFCLANLVAQNKIAEKVSELQGLKVNFRPISVLSVTQNTIDRNVNKVVDEATLATINFEKVNEIVSNQYGTLELEIPYQNQTISILLYQVNPFLEGFHIDTNEAKNNSYQNGVYYRGIIKGEATSIAAFNFFNGEFNGVISSSGLGNVVVGKLDKTNNLSDYIVYSDSKMKVSHQFDCQLKENLPFTPKNGETNRNVNSVRCVAFYFEVDNDIYQGNGNNLTSTINWMTSVFNNVQTLYNNDGISVGLKSIFVWTTPDPYATIAMTSIAHLNAFKDYRPVFDGDLGMLVGIDPQPVNSGGLGGVAFLDTLCTPNNYAYVDADLFFAPVPTFSWTIEAITHEFGHSMGSPHTHGCYWNGNNTAIDGCGQQAGYFEPSQVACPIGPIPPSGTIMSYCHLISGVGINFNNGFGPQPAALILSNVNTSTCLSTSCINSCPNTVAQILTSDITSTSVRVTWTDIGTATSWQIAVTPFSSSAIVWNTVTTNSFTVAGLIPNTYYIIRIRPYCPGIQPLIREKIFATLAPDFCANVVFTDTGGPTGNYSNMEYWVRTMTPNNAGSKLKVTFSSIDLETDWDFLFIYDGPSEFYPELTGGGLTGNGSLSLFNSTATNGALTFKFISDQGTVAEGWSALITCTGALGIEDNDFLDYSYYPNPTTGKVTVSSKDVITEIAVYNIQGQLLFNKKMNNVTTDVDITQFASGTYFFRLKINGREANFKIIKH